MNSDLFRMAWFATPSAPDLLLGGGELQALST